MLPKFQAAVEFVEEREGRTALITSYARSMMHSRVRPELRSCLSKITPRRIMLIEILLGVLILRLIFSQILSSTQSENMFS